MRASTRIILYLAMALCICVLVACIGEPEESDAGQTVAPVLPTPSEGPAPAGQQEPLPSGTGDWDKWALWVNGPHLRGANIWQAVVIPELDGLEFKGPGAVGAPFSQEDFDLLASLGANYVSISGPGLFSEDPPYEVDLELVAHLDGLLEKIAQADMFATIGFRTGPGRSEFSLCCGGDPYFEGYFDDSMWESDEAQDAWVEMWRFAAGHYRDNPIVAGYKLMVEPNAAGVLLDIYDPEEFYPEYAGTLYDWNQLYPRLVAAIREVDRQTPVLVGGMNWSRVEWLPYLQPIDDARTAYVVHQYEPQDEYTHQEASGENSYPGSFDIDWDGEDDVFDRAWIEGLLSTVNAYADAHGVPLAVDEFGVNRWVPGAAAFMDDQMAVFEDLGLNHAIWEWSTSWEPFAEDVSAMNYRLGPDPANDSDFVQNDLLDVIIKYWSRNTIRPSDMMQRDRVPVLPSVQHWISLIGVELEEDTIDQIVSSEYDMVVLDYVPSEESNADFPMADVVARLHGTPQPKLVLAYIDIGEAEDYRTYWQPGWEIDDPAWIVGSDPDGWESNYPVAYWDEEYQQIWLGPDGYLQGILDAGFDGVYLDWVEAYSDEDVSEAAEADGVDPVREMIDWVGAIARFGRSQNPEFLVVAQNAAELAAYDEYVNVIDAIAQEQVWFDGGADNKPPGDCPLPRTEADVETDAYVSSLSPSCRRQHDQCPDSTLHMSSEEYLADLEAAQAKGLTIFTLDYALDPDNVAWIYQTARDSGFIPFVGTRALHRYEPPYP